MSSTSALRAQQTRTRSSTPTFGVRFADERVTTSVKVTNLANQEVMQHVFGDVLKRQVVGEVRVGF